MTTKRRRYTRLDRAKALGIAVVKSQAAAADQTGIPLTTINHWWRSSPEIVELRNTAKEEFISQLWQAVQIGVAEVVKGLGSDAPLRDKTVAASMLAEKYLLLSGQATVRTETRDLTDSMSDHEREVLRTILEGVVLEEATT